MRHYLHKFASRVLNSTTKKYAKSLRRTYHRVRWKTVVMNGDYFVWERGSERVTVYWNRNHETWAVKITSHTNKHVLETTTKLPFDGAIYIADTYMSPDHEFNTVYLKKQWESLRVFVDKHDFFVTHPIALQTTQKRYPSFDMSIATTH